MKKNWNAFASALALGVLVGALATWIYYASRLEKITSMPNDGKEAIVAASPDAAYKAVVWLPDVEGFGATVSQSVQVWLERSKSSPERRLVFEADKTDGVRLVWTKANELQICYPEAQISRFNNRYISVERLDGLPNAKTVEIILKRVSKLTDC